MLQLKYPEAGKRIHRKISQYCDSPFMIIFVILSQSFVEINSSTWLYSCKKRKPFSVILKIRSSLLRSIKPLTNNLFNYSFAEHKREMPYV